MPLDRRAQRLLDMLAASGGDAPSTPAARRSALQALADVADDRTTAADIAELAAPGPSGPIPLRLYAPPDAGPVTPAVVFFHGGGWVAGDLATHDGFCRRLASACRCRIVAVDYRLAPEHPFPAAFDDALAATQWAAAAAAQLGVDPDRLGVAGDSVGGGLAAAVARAARDAGGPKLALQALICPILDVAKRDGSREAFGDGYFISRAAFARDLADYRGGGDDDPRLSPARAGDLAGLPPAVIHTAEFDPFRDEAEAYAAALAAAGVPTRCERHPGMIHYFYALARAIPAGVGAATQFGAQIRDGFQAPG